MVGYDKVANIFKGAARIQAEREEEEKEQQEVLDTQLKFESLSQLQDRRLITYEHLHSQYEPCPEDLAAIAAAEKDKRKGLQEMLKIKLETNRMGNP